MPSALTLLHAIKAHDWHAANETFARVMNQKIADRLVSERQVAFSEATNQSQSLADWVAKTGRPAIPHRDGVVYIPDFVGDNRPELWDLRDYRVTSVSGGTIWLVPRTIPGGKDHWGRPLGENLADEPSEGEAIQKDNEDDAAVKEALIDQPLKKTPAKYLTITKKAGPTAAERDNRVNALGQNRKLDKDGRIVTESLILGDGMPRTEIERVFREIGDRDETALLCGVPISALSGFAEAYQYSQAQTKMVMVPEAEDATVKQTKAALVRDPGHPIGQSAPMSIKCIDCGTTIPNAGTGDVTCPECAARYDKSGWQYQFESFPNPPKKVSKVQCPACGKDGCPLCKYSGGVHPSTADQWFQQNEPDSQRYQEFKDTQKKLGKK